MNTTFKTVFSTESRKAWGSGIVAFFSSLQLAVGEGGTLADVTTYEWLGIAVAVLGAYGITYALKNGNSDPVMSDAQFDRFMGFAGEKPLDITTQVPGTLNTIGTSDVER